MGKNALFMGKNRLKIWLRGEAMSRNLEKR